MSITIRRLAVAIQAGMNAPSDYVARAVAPESPVLGQAEIIPGTYAYQARYLRESRSNFTGPRGRSLTRTPGQPPVQRQISMTEESLRVEETVEDIVMTDREFADVQRNGLVSFEDRRIRPALEADFLIDEELRFVELFTSGALSQGFGNTDAARQWSSDGVNPIRDIDAGFDAIKKGSSLKPNLFAITKNYVDAMKHNGYLRGLLRLDERGMLTGRQIGDIIRAALYELSPTVMAEAGTDFEIVVALGVHDAASEGQTSDHEYIWPTGAILLARPEVNAAGATTIEAPGAMKTFVAARYEVTRNEDKNNDTVFYRGRLWSRPAVTDALAAYTFTGMTAAG